MTSELPSVRITDEERTYLALRIALLPILLLLLYFPGTEPSGRGLGLGALALACVGTVILVWAAQRDRTSVARTIMWVLPLDLVAAVVLTALSAASDGLYPTYVVASVLSAMVLSRRHATILVIGLALAYAIGHVVVPVSGALAIALIAFKTITILALGLIVSISMVNRRESELEFETQGAETTSANLALRRRLAVLQAASEVTELIHSSLDLDEVGLPVLEIISKVIEVPTMAIFVLDKAKSETLFSASVGLPHDQNRHQGGSLGLGEVEAHMTCRRVFDHGSMMVLFCALAQAMDRLTEEDQLIINSAASELVVAVENSRLYKLTKRLAITDELTGMSNYRYLQQRLDEEVSRAKRYHKHLSLIMIDADDFKDFNDRFGHLAGDRALAEFAHVLASVVREVDVAARYGGEEFAILLPETDAAGAFVVAEKIREALADHAFADSDGNRCCTLTVSVGVATYPTYARDKESLLREADDALYRAKDAGKNRVCAPRLEPRLYPISGDES